MIEAGDTAPDASYEKPDGSVARISDHRGRALVLYFYPKDDTSGCTSEAKDFSALLPDFTAAGADVLGVSKDSGKKHRAFTEKHGLAVPLGTDADGSLCEAFGTWVEKSMYGRKYMGIERATFLIDADGRVAKAWRKVKVPGHAADVLAAVRGLG